MEVSQSSVEDGQNGYLFDNKYIIVVHWNGFSDEDRIQTTQSGIKLRMLPTENGFWTTVRFGTYRWGDVITLPGLMTSFNDLSSPFTDLIFLFVDSSDGTPVAIRSFPLDTETGEFLKNRCRVSYDWFASSGRKKPQYRLLSELNNDWEAASDSIIRRMTSNDAAMLASAVGSVGLDIDKDNNIGRVNG